MEAVCVFCGSSDAVATEYLEAAKQVGRVLAGHGLKLVFGGGKTGLMGALAEGALEKGGEIIGVIIPSMHTTELAHPGLTRMEVVENMHARKARMHALADGYMALPGGFGTFDELFETLTWSQTGEHEKPVGLLNTREYFAPLLEALRHAVQEGFIFQEHLDAMACEVDPEILLKRLQAYKHPHAAVKRWMREG
jgi:uncharacterized protein (TIGR00730 family)